MVQKYVRHGLIGTTTIPRRLNTTLLKRKERVSNQREKIQTFILPQVKPITSKLIKDLNKIAQDLYS